MSSLRSALDELRMDDLGLLSDDALSDRLDEIERAGRVLEAERGRGLAEIERRRVYAADGHLSAAAWLAHRQGLSRSAAEGALRRSLALERMPVVARALGEGEVSASAVQVLAAAREAAPEAFARSEAELVQAARTMGFGGLRRVAETWRAAADPDRALEDEDRRHELRRLDVCPDEKGMTGVRGELDTEDGQVLITSIRAQMDAETRHASGPDARTPTQRRADALGEICRQWLASRDRPSIGGERPHVVVTIDLDTLLERSGTAELGDSGSVTAETARRLACDADVTRVITREASEPLELGRRTKVVPPGLRRAVAVRDRGCRFPGCGRPPGWCDAHHVRHWADGGETSLSNLVLLCRPHHRAIHRGFGVEMLECRPVFTRPDGSPIIADRAPPPDP
ncbi:MAG TPA: DUF222 domain-containing protein [Actinomycetota bacterium]|nr:DUF222 domain-containing protein [Actinomycetota bacterium]